MTQSPPDLLGRLAVHYQLITMEQLAAATHEQSRSPHKKLGAILVELDFIDQNQLAQLLEAQRQYLAQQAKQAPQVLHRAVGPKQPPPPPTAPHAPPPPPPQAAAQPPARPRPPPEREVAYNPARVQWLHRVLQRAVSMNASDVHIHSGAQVKVRVYGNLLDLMPELLSKQECESVLVSAMDARQRELYFDEGQVDFTYGVPHVARFRTNIYQQHSGPCGVFHFIPAEPPLLSDLGLPSAAAKLVNHKNGIVLITGPAGSGKTSTMAALVNLLNEERADHVLSIEDPIEYLHTSKRCVVNQREVSRHTRSFANALRSALREDPDVICVGELRDLETISLALSAAETGHLVLGTLHTQGAVRTINRVIGAYPPNQQAQVRTMISESLRAVISQKLIPRADRTGMALAYELLLMNVASANLIRENRTFQLASVLQTGKARGMRAMDDSLAELVAKNIISKKEAALHAEDPRAFR
jgi:twitching motility protein PilT